MNLAVGTEGSGSSPTYQWTLVQGGGSLSDTSGESVTLTVGSSPDYYEIKVEDTQSNEVAHHSVQSVRVTLEFEDDYPCDGSDLNVTVKAYPQVLEGELQNVSLRCHKPNLGDVTFDNPIGAGSEIVQRPGGSPLLWRISNVRWYSTEPGHCNQQSIYFLSGTIELDGVVIEIVENAFAADTSGACINGTTIVLSTWYSGQLDYSVQQNDGEDAVAEFNGLGNFSRAVVADVSYAPTLSTSQLYPMIKAEEDFHKSQFEGTVASVVEPNLYWVISNVVDDLSGKKFYGATLAEAANNAHTSFSNAAFSEHFRSQGLFAAYPDVLQPRCSLESQAKSEVGASHRLAMACAYGDC